MEVIKLLSVGDYQAIINYSKIYAICRIISSEKVKEFKESCEVEVFADELMTKTKVVKYAKVKEVLMDHKFDYMFLKKFKIDELNEKDREYLEKEFPADVKGAKKVYLCVDPNILLEIWIILGLLTYKELDKIIFDIQNLLILGAFDDFKFYAPKDCIAPLIVQLKLYPQYFSIIAPVFIFK